MSDSNQTLASVFKVVCDKHGDLCTDRKSDPQDHIAADLVKREHEEQCPGPVSIEEFDQEDLEAEPASRIAERQKERHANNPDSEHCPKCMAFIGDSEECGRCGKEVQKAA